MLWPYTQARCGAVHVQCSEEEEGVWWGGWGRGKKGCGGVAGVEGKRGVVKGGVAR